MRYVEEIEPDDYWCTFTKGKAIVTLRAKTLEDLIETLRQIENG